MKSQDALEYLNLADRDNDSPDAIRYLQYAQVISAIATASALEKIADRLDGLLYTVQDMNESTEKGKQP
jgi:hypothetical protein